MTLVLSHIVNLLLDSMFKCPEFIWFVWFCEAQNIADSELSFILLFIQCLNQELAALFGLCVCFMRFSNPKSLMKFIALYSISCAINLNKWECADRKMNKIILVVLSTSLLKKQRPQLWYNCSKGVGLLFYKCNITAVVNWSYDLQAANKRQTSNAKTIDLIWLLIVWSSLLLSYNFWCSKK